MSDTEAETIEMEAPVWSVDMPGGMPDLLFPEDDYDGAVQHATGERLAEIDDDQEGEERISILDFEGSREVPIADV